MNILEAVLFVLTTAAAMAVLLMFPKRRDKANLIVWAIMTFITLLGFWTFLAGFVCLIGVPFNLFTLSGVNVFVAAVTFAFMRVRGLRQSYYISRKDVLMMLLLLVLTAAIALMRFGVRFDVFAYNSSDSARHFSYVKDIISNQKIITGGSVVYTRYVMYILDVIFIKIFDPVIGADNWYRAFMLADVFAFFLMGAAFWCWVRKYAQGRFSSLVCALFTVCYFLGYPLNNLLYGFEYLGMGILSLTYLLWVLQKAEAKSVRAWTWIIMLFSANTLVCMSYTQFSPAVIAGEIIYMIIYLRRRKKLWSFISLLTLVFGFVLPFALCISYMAPWLWSTFVKVLLIVVLFAVLCMLIAYAVFFIISVKTGRDLAEIIQVIHTAYARSRVTHVALAFILAAAAVFVLYKYLYLGILVPYTMEAGVMVSDGSIYREPYANFIILFFPVLLFAIKSIQQRRNEAVLWILLITVLYSVWLLFMIISGYIGSYYFYKMHFIVWIMFMGIGCRFFATIERGDRQIAVTYLGMVMFFMMITLLGLDKKLDSTNAWLWPTDTLQSLYGVFDNNVGMLQNGGNVTVQMQEIYNKVYELAEQSDTFIPYFGTNLYYFIDYYYYLSNQDATLHPYDLNNESYYSFDIRGDLEKRDILYIFVQKENYKNPYEYYKGEFDVMWTEYENDYGWILKLD